MFSFEVWAGSERPEYPRVVNAITPGKAKSAYLSIVREPWPDLKFTQIKCRKIGEPYTDEEFLQFAQRRGLEFVRCGMKVEIDGRKAIITGKCGAYFRAYFFDTKCEGNFHPTWEVKYFDAKGKLILDTKKEKQESMNKKIISTGLAMLLSFAITAPSEAKRLNARKIIGAPFVAIGFAGALVADVTVIPLYKGAKHYVIAPAVKGW